MCIRDRAHAARFDARSRAPPKSQCICVLLVWLSLPVDHQSAQSRVKRALKIKRRVTGGVRERRRLTEEAKGGPWVALDEIQTCSAARCGASPHLSSSQATTYDNTTRGHRCSIMHSTIRTGGSIHGRVLTTDPPGTCAAPATIERQHTINAFGRLV